MHSNSHWHKGTMKDKGSSYMQDVNVDENTEYNT